MGAWLDLNGPVKRIAGTVGTQTLANGGKILRIWAHASGAGASVAFPSGIGSGTVTVAVANGATFWYEPLHLGCVVPAGGTLTFTSTDSFLVEYME